MARLDSTLWQNMMAYLRQRHGPICRQWFEDLEPVGLDSGLLRVQTHNSVQQRYLQRKCVSQFTEAAQAVTGNLVAVHFVNADEAPPAASATSSPHPAAPIRYEMIRPSATGRDDDAISQILLSPDYSFDNFVRGPENQMAYAASVAVVNQLGTAYNPLFVHGGVGLGKTHLLQAICQEIIKRTPDLRICYLACDTFVNDFMDCVQRGDMNDFRFRYRQVDLLVIDDIQFLANRERTQEEFFHTFNELYQAKRQIVLSSDRPPTDIPDLEERLVSRFKWGLVTDVGRPTYETRVAIVRAKANLRGVEIPDDVIAYIADKIDTNARELEGAITSLQHHASSQNRPITADLAYEVLGEPPGDPRLSQVTLQQIIDAVTNHYGVKLSDLQSKRRQKSIAEPRQVCMWLARARTRFSLQEIGGYFGGRDHTTVMHSIRTIEDRVKQDAGFAHEISRLEDQIGRGGPYSSG